MDSAMGVCHLAEQTEGPSVWGQLGAFTSSVMTRPGLISELVGEGKTTGGWAAAPKRAADRSDP